GTKTCRPSGARLFFLSQPGAHAPGYKDIAPNGATFITPYKISSPKRGELLALREIAFSQLFAKVSQIS
ncbi:MAG: hypothetical protein WA004_02140, partial [Saprospiraceae bacterium]